MPNLPQPEWDAAYLDAEGEMMEMPACWGAELHGGAGCSPGFVPGKLHFKNKFCDNCRAEVRMPWSRCGH